METVGCNTELARAAENLLVSPLHYILEPEKTLPDSTGCNFAAVWPRIRATYGQPMILGAQTLALQYHARKRQPSQ